MLQICCDVDSTAEKAVWSLELSGIPWFRVHGIILNDPGRLISVHLTHTAVIAGWAGSSELHLAQKAGLLVVTLGWAVSSHFGLSS